MRVIDKENLAEEHLDCYLEHEQTLVDITHPPWSLESFGILFAFFYFGRRDLLILEQLFLISLVATHY